MLEIAYLEHSAQNQPCIAYFVLFHAVPPYHCTHITHSHLLQHHQQHTMHPHHHIIKNMLCNHRMNTPSIPLKHARNCIFGAFCTKPATHCIFCAFPCCSTMPLHPHHPILTCYNTTNHIPCTHTTPLSKACCVTTD